MAPATLDHDAALDHFLDQIVFTLALLHANPHTGQLAQGFDQLLEQWWEVDKQETLCWIEILKAAARIVAADNRLDAIVDKLVAVLAAEEAEGRAQGVRQVLLNNRRPGDLKRPVLSSQLATMRAWVAPLKASPLPPLQAIGADLEAAIQAADKAVEDLATAKRQNREFRAAGARKAHVDGLNAVRKQVWGTLAEMPHSRPELGLPASFPNDFYKPVRRRSGAAGAPQDAVALAAKIAELEEQIAGLKAEHADLLAREEDLAKERAVREADQTALAEAEREAEAMLARVAALRAKVGG